MQTALRSPTRGYTIALVGIVLWSTTAVLIRYLSEQYRLPPLVLAFWRDLLTALCLVVGLLIVRRSLLAPPGLRRHLPFLVLYGLILATFNGLWTTSVTLNGAAVATVLAYSAPAFTALLGWRLFRERLNAAKIGAIALGIMGCVLVSGAYDPGVWQVNPLGIAVGLTAGVAFAGYSLMGKAAAQRGLSAWTSMVYTFSFATGFLLLLQRPETILWLGSDLGGWGVLALLAVAPTLGGYGLYTLSLEYLPASVASLLATLEPPLTALWSYLLLAEMMTGVQWLGAGVILGGVVLLRMQDARGKKQDA